MYFNKAEERLSNIRIISSISWLMVLYYCLSYCYVILSQPWDGVLYLSKSFQLSSFRSVEKWTSNDLTRNVHSHTSEGFPPSFSIIESVRFSKVWKRFLSR